MKHPVLLAVLSTTVLSSMAFARAPLSPKVIYGEDGRQEVFEASELNQRLAKSTATMVALNKMTRLDEKKGLVQLNQDTLSQWMAGMSGPAAKELFSPALTSAVNDGMGFCEAERFTEQPNPGMCSGFLIAPDLLVTAGHCVTSFNFCNTYSWVFEFQVDKDSKTAGVDVKEENVYGCKKVVTNSLNNFLSTDYAVIQLDRIVKDRQPLDIRLEGEIALKTPLTVIGSPSGLPLKVTIGGAVRKSLHPNFFVGSLDTYQGNSGSAVFNAETGVIEGILVRGENDFVPNADNFCIESNKCTDDACRGEDVSRIRSVPEIAVMNVLADAAVSGDKAKLDQILKIKLWVDIYGKDRTSAMMKAAAAGQAISVETLLAKGADVTLTDLEGNTALHLLAAGLNESNVETLDKLVAGKASLEAKNAKGNTSSLVAAQALNLSGVKLLINAGADKHAVNLEGETVLYSFARAGDILSVLELTDAGVNPNVTNRFGVSALDMKDKNGDTLLLAAAKTSTVENVLRLARVGANINAKDMAGETAIYAVIKSKSIEGLKALIKAGARVMTESRVQVTPMELAKSIGFKEARAIIRAAEKDEKRIDVAQE